MHPHLLHCTQCGLRLTLGLPDDGDTRQRAICTACGHIHYQNPHLIVGTLPLWVTPQGQETVLLCLRNIEPRKNKWTLPAGFMELGETAAQGAARETQEEAGLTLQKLELFTLYDVVKAGQVHLFYRATVENPLLNPGQETVEARYFLPENIPWEQLAFRTVEQTLRAWLQAKETKDWSLRTGQVG